MLELTKIILCSLRINSSRKKNYLEWILKFSQRLCVITDQQTLHYQTNLLAERALMQSPALLLAHPRLPF